MIISPDTELRIVETSRHRDIKFDLASSVLQERDGQLHGELCRVRALYFIAKGELVDKDIVL